MGTELERGYRSRLADEQLDRLLDELPAISVVGPRAVGKTTTLARRAATVVRLDVDTQQGAFAVDADAALRRVAEPVLLDEWQAVPDVLGAVRRAVDADWRPARFLISGSVRARVRLRVWPATGRIVQVEMYPMSVREQLGVTGPGFVDRLLSGDGLVVPRDTPDVGGYMELAVQSGFPRAALELSGDARQAWLRSYVEDLLTNDVDLLAPTATRPRDVQRLRRFLEAYALNSAGTADLQTINEAAGVSKVTGAAYEDLLLDLLVAEQVPAWASNRLRRLARRPKRYLVDAGLMAAALRVDVAGILRDGDLIGRMIDTFVAAQLRPELAARSGGGRLHHLRTTEGRHEVDLLIEFGGGRVIAIEVKAAAAVKGSDARHLRWLRDHLGDRFVAGVVLHTGPYAFRLDERIVAAPISTLWG